MSRSPQQQNDPAQSSWDITPTDDLDIPVTRGLSSNSGGNVNVMLVNDDVPHVRFMLRGVVYGWSVRRVYATETDASHVAGYR